jgi:hypothetical protein
VSHPAASDRRRMPLNRCSCTSRCHPAHRGCVPDKRDRVSQRRGFAENPQLQVRAETALGQDVDSSSRQFLEILLKRDHVQKCSAGFNVHQQIDVAVLAIVAAGRPSRTHGCCGHRDGRPYRGSPPEVHERLESHQASSDRVRNEASRPDLGCYWSGRARHGEPHSSWSERRKVRSFRSAHEGSSPRRSPSDRRAESFRHQAASGQPPPNSGERALSTFRFRRWKRANSVRSNRWKKPATGSRCSSAESKWTRSERATDSTTAGWHAAG